MDAPGSAELVMMLCPNLKCRKVLRVPASCRGKHVRCQFCHMTFEVPRPKKQNNDEDERNKMV